MVWLPVCPAFPLWVPRFGPGGPDDRPAGSRVPGAGRITGSTTPLVGVSVFGRVTTPGTTIMYVFADPDPVFAAGSSAVTEFKLGELAPGGVRRERGDPVPVDIGDAELRPGVGSFLTGDDPHPGWPPLKVE